VRILISGSSLDPGGPQAFIFHNLPQEALACQVISGSTVRAVDGVDMVPALMELIF
jgi:hypothetical protein